MLSIHLSKYRSALYTGTMIDILIFGLDMPLIIPRCLFADLANTANHIFN